MSDEYMYIWCREVRRILNAQRERFRTLTVVLDEGNEGESTVL